MANPSDGLLKACTKAQLREVALHFNIEISSQWRKDRIFSVVKESLIQSGVLSGVVKGTDTQDAESPQQGLSEQPVRLVQSVAGVGVALTFEQQKELLTLQHKLEVDREEKARAQVQAVEMERLKLNARLREAELEQMQERQRLERYKLDLIREGKMLESPVLLDPGRASSSKFDVSSGPKIFRKGSRYIFFVV